MEENINEKQQENNNADHLNADNLNKETAENNKPDYKEFTVSLSSIDYEGPLSILFDMMKRSEKNIYEVSILEIIDQFVEYLKAQAALNLDSTGDFLVVASEFHLYKSKMLLPHDMDDDKFTDRLKFEIVEQMLEFQRYKMVSEELDKLQDVSDSIFERKDTERVKFFQNIDSAEDNEVAWKDITLYDLVYAFTKVQFVPETDLAVLSGMSNFHIDNAIDMIRIKLSESAFFPFIVLFKDGVTKRQLVTFFLAMLELVKEKEILLKQEMKFKEIYVFKRDESFMPKAEETDESDNEVAWKDVTLYDLVNAFTKVQIVPETDLAVLSGMSNFHIDNAIDMIRIKLSETTVFPFIVLFKDGVTKRQLVTFFLAMLELVKEKEILLKQEMRFKEIYVFKRDENFMPKAEETDESDNEEQENNNSEEVSNNEENIEEVEKLNENTENISNNENSDNQNQ